MLGWPIFRLLGFVFLLRERAGSRAINPCPLAPAARAAEGRQGLMCTGAEAALHEEEGWGSGDVAGAGAAVNLEGREKGP